MDFLRQPASVLYKDEVLYRIGAYANVAQFVSFGTGLNKRFHRIRGLKDAVNQDLTYWVEELFKRVQKHKVNIRTFRPELTKGTEFLQGLTEVPEVVSQLKRLANSGYYTIVNETIDMSNGGIGGVQVGGLIEFAPCDTPRAVEASGTVSVARAAGIRMLETVYGQSLALNYEPNLRVEFTVHPMRCGLENEHTVIWEVEAVEKRIEEVPVLWPNRFSRFIGDKAFGLLLCHAFGIRVPRTLVISRVLPPFQFGESTGTGETWLRTCPRDRAPGRFTTLAHWTDPFELLQAEDPKGDLISSVLAQEGVLANYSGSLLSAEDGELMIEGVNGIGSTFMLGRKSPEALPDSVVDAVKALYGEVSTKVGAASIEWVFDGQRAWLLQAHAGATKSRGKVLVQGIVDDYVVFDVKEGLGALRKLVSSIDPKRTGIVVAGDVGVTSHVGELLRQYEIVSYIEPNARG
jgi:hypothetical protein